MTVQQKKVIIIGGGIAGLMAAILLSRKGIPCTVLERKQYPFHRVCGEYISNETVPFLKRNGIFLGEFNPPDINELELSDGRGRSALIPLPVGGFGISRFSLDNYLANEARRSGAEILQGTDVNEVSFLNNSLIAETSAGKIESNLVLGCFGKRSKLDVKLNRQFTQSRSPFVGVKYHVETDHPRNRIALHNFNGGYCGVNRVEEGKVNLCYLVHREVVKKFGDLKEMERQVLSENPILKSIFQNSRFLWNKPETVNEISFQTKEPVFNHMLMLGDSAGMIAPLCGNGMAMAIRSASMASLLIEQYYLENKTRQWLESSYESAWRKQFSWQLKRGRLIQHYLFGNPFTSSLALKLALGSSTITKLIVKSTHGETL